MGEEGWHRDTQVSAAESPVPRSAPRPTPRSQLRNPRPRLCFHAACSRTSPFLLTLPRTRSDVTAASSLAPSSLLRPEIPTGACPCPASPLPLPSPRPQTPLSAQCDPSPSGFCLHGPPLQAVSLSPSFLRVMPSASPSTLPCRKTLPAQDSRSLCPPSSCVLCFSLPLLARRPL